MRLIGLHGGVVDKRVESLAAWMGCATHKYARQDTCASRCRNQVQIYRVDLKRLNCAGIGIGIAGPVDYVEKLAAAFRGKKLRAGGGGGERRMRNLLKRARIGIYRIHFYIVQGSAHEQEAAFKIESQLVHRCPAQERRARHGSKDSCDVIARKDGDTGTGPTGSSTCAEHEWLLELGVRRNRAGENGAGEEREAQDGRERGKRYECGFARRGNVRPSGGHGSSAVVIEATHTGSERETVTIFRLAR